MVLIYLRFFCGHLVKLLLTLRNRRYRASTNKLPRLQINFCHFVLLVMPQFLLQSDSDSHLQQAIAQPIINLYTLVS